jgi:lipopolysaccharide/colanic/teichoic acid biosynthesis glycosyltransferase
VPQLDAAMQELTALPFKVQLCPDGMTLAFRTKEASQLGSFLLVNVESPPLNSRQLICKSVLDYFVSTIAVILLAPLMLVIAIAIKLDSKGSVFFVQSRNGYAGAVILEPRPCGLTARHADSR